MVMINDVQRKIAREIVDTRSDAVLACVFITLAEHFNCPMPTVLQLTNLVVDRLNQLEKLAGTE